jgi:hypothetical protein
MIRDNIERKLFHEIGEITSETIYVVDWTETDRHRDVEIVGKSPSIKSVCIHNHPKVPVYFDAFQDNALPVKKGICSPQCECMIWPTTEKNCWILFVETKYAKNRKAALREDSDYPPKMVNQVLETVRYFRDRGMIDSKQTVHAIVSFPALEDNFHDELFDRLQGTQWSVECMKREYNIIVRGCNGAVIDSEKRIRVRVAVD